MCFREFRTFVSENVSPHHGRQIHVGLGLKVVWPVRDRPCISHRLVSSTNSRQLDRDWRLANETRSYNLWPPPITHVDPRRLLESPTSSIGCSRCSGTCRLHMVTLRFWLLFDTFGGMAVCKQRDPQFSSNFTLMHAACSIKLSHYS